jgi:deoxyribonuclease I
MERSAGRVWLGLLAALGGLAAASGCTRPESFAAVEVKPQPVIETPRCDAERAPPVPETEQELAQVMAWVYRDQPLEAYCGCAFGADGSVAADACGYSNVEDPAPAVRWEPIVPPSRYGAYRKCWQGWALEPGAASPNPDNELARRKCAETDAEFGAMDADLYNLQPVIAALSQHRRDFPFGQVQGEPREYGACDFEMQSVMGKSARVEPPPEIRGDIARTYFYMAGKYGKGKDWKIKLTREQRKLYEQWSAADPVDDRERLRACRIQAVQGWENPFVK